MNLRGHVLLLASCAVLIGLVEGVVAVAQGKGGVLGIVASMAALAVVGALLGLLQGLVVTGLRRVAERLELPAWWRRHTSSDRAAAREPVVALHSGVVGVVAGAALLLGGLWVGLGALRDVADDALRRELTVLYATFVLVAAVGVALLVARLVGPVLRRIDERVALPWPHQPGLQLLLYAALPAAAILLPPLLRHRAVLGMAALALLLPLLPIGEAIVLAGWRAATRRRQPPLPRPRWFAVGWVLALVVAALVLRAPSAASAVQATVASKLAVDGLRSASDFDRDGASSLFGGRDCAPFDARRSPSAGEIPGNGVDEDCDGKDAEGRRPGPGVERRAVSWSSPRGRERAKVRPDRYNVVWVIVDAIRADRAGITGAKRATTPFLSSIADESLVFQQAFSQSSATMLSIPSMLTGLDPGSIEWDKGGGKLQPAKNHLMFAERLKQEGYRSAIVVDGYMRKAVFGINQGFDDVLDIWLDGNRKPWHERSAAVGTTLAIDWLEKDTELGPDAGQPFFLLLYTSNPHDPYVVHPEYAADYGKSEMDRYDSEIAFADRWTGFFIDYLRYRQLWDKTIFVFTADHGEEFGEHGGKIHAYTCYHESVHVPLLVRVPGMEAANVTRRVGLMDILPTLLEALGLEPGRMQIEGQTLLAPAFAPEETDEQRPLFCAVLSQKSKQGNFFRRSVRVGDRMLVHEEVSDEWELYDTVKDTDETRNLVSEGSEAVTLSALRGLIDGSITGNLSDRKLTR
ncbi:MAG: sulfatase [Polyangiaceae bacterium]